MATTLEKYRERMEQCRRAIAEKQFRLSDIVCVQELGYRVCVLETMRSFSMTAPETTDTKALCFHYKVVDAYVQSLLTERKFGIPTDEEGKKKRETALRSMESVVADYRRRFGSFRANAPETYRKCIVDVINAVLPVWMQYRDALIKL